MHLEDTNSRDRQTDRQTDKLCGQPYCLCLRRLRREEALAEILTCYIILSMCGIAVLGAKRLLPQDANG